MGDQLSSCKAAQQQGSKTTSAHPTVCFYSSQDNNKTMRRCYPHSGSPPFHPSSLRPSKIPLEACLPNILSDSEDSQANC